MQPKRLDCGVGYLRPKRSSLGKYWSLDPDLIFLNHGSFGATPNLVMDEQHRLRTHLESDPVRFFERYAFGLMNRARLETLRISQCRLRWNDFLSKCHKWRKYCTAKFGS